MLLKIKIISIKMAFLCKMKILTTSLKNIYLKAKTSYKTKKYNLLRL